MDPFNCLRILKKEGGGIEKVNLEQYMRKFLFPQF